MALLLALRAPHKPALLGLLAIYVAGSAVAALAPNYAVMAVARVVTGAASAACFGVSLAIAAELVSPETRGRAASVVLGGLMLAPVFGLPATTAIAQAFGWRASFWAVVAVSALCALVAAARIQASTRQAQVSLSDEWVALKQGRLWAAYATSGLIIGATFSAFSYATSIFTELTRLPSAAMPVVLAAYGMANVVGNYFVGRVADRHTIPTLLAGLVALAVALTAFSLFVTHTIGAVAAFLVIGLVGVPMNPAMVARVMSVAHPGSLVNTVHTSVITTGIAFGSWAGGLGIDCGYGLRMPLWTGVALAIAGLVTLLPRRARELGGAPQANSRRDH